ncbi:hypothetical protein [Patulibacter sp. SYSU D01012]|uniref:hypothetical protein n=1 Tax=Patulibacter sp. SYSU D01012 TaxID=2817381 RepID=UPI001B300D25|nr:hypothetical protein [Patulibacter sp. SYSU D01012]
MTARQKRLVKAPAARPAETSGVGGGVATILAYVLGASPEVIAALGVIAGALPAVVTWLVAHGGIRGTLRALWRGTPTKD